MDIINNETIIEQEQHEITSSVTQDINITDNEDLEVSVNKREYSIVGDAMYASTSADNAPQWLNSIIDEVVGNLINGKISDLDEARNSILQAIEEIEIAKNQYTQLINIEQTIDSVLATKLETLNATVAQNSASILNLDNAKVSEDEALAIAANHLTAELDNGDIRSAINTINTAISTGDQTNASSITALQSTFEDNIASINQTITTHSDEISASVASVEALKAYVDVDGSLGYGGQSVMRNELTASEENVQAKFMYGSTLTLPNGQSYTTGFGMTTESQGNEGDSEFWINAEKLKFTNNTTSGYNTPFSIDASGTTPQISFNGIVSFKNVTSSPVGTGSTTFKGNWYSSSVKNIEELEGWTNYSGDGELSLGPDGLSIGDSLDNDQQWLIFDKSIPINKNKRYKITVQAKRTDGIGVAYFGMAGRDSTDTLWVNSLGNNSTGSQFYFISSYVLPTNLTTIESEFWSTNGAVDGSTQSIRDDVEYYRPIMIVNYSGQPGNTVIKSFTIEELEADIVERLGDNNDEIANNLGYTDYNSMLSAAQSGNTIINGGYINTNVIEANSINADKINATNLYAQHIDVNNPTTGFILDSDSQGTSSSPNIQGAYIKGSIIEGTNIIAQNLIEVFPYRTTALYPGAGTFLCVEKTFTLDIPKKVIIQIDTNYYCSISYTSGGSTDEFKAQLLINGAEVYSSKPLRLERTTGDYSYDFYNENSLKPIPETHTYIVDLPAGTHNAQWKCIQTSPVGSELVLNYTFRSIIVTAIKED